jgi:hypothetical protein
MIPLLNLIFWVTLLLYILLETDAPVEYGRFLHLKFIKYKQFEEKQQLFPDLKYSQFLSNYYPNFFIKLMTCQTCLAAWLNILAFTFFSKDLGGWQFLGITIIGSWIGVAGLKLILNKLYE